MTSRSHAFALDIIANAESGAGTQFAGTDVLELARAYVGMGKPGYVLVPVEPTEKMWGGLARDLGMWQRFKHPTGRALYEHLIMLGRPIPDWLSKEIKNIDHLPPSGTVAACIYKAMLDAARPPSEGRDG